MQSPEQSSNFNFLAEHDSLLVELAQAAERVFSSDPNTTLIKLRQLGEALAQHLASIVGVEFSEQTGLSNLIMR
jgi:type I restriction enzyme R subunit